MVTTPQSTSIQVTRRVATMFQKLNVPVIGVVENMSTVKCPKCDHNVKLFGEGVDKFAKEVNTSVLLRVPLIGGISECADKGVPIVIEKPGSDVSLGYNSLANYVVNYLNKPV